MTKRVLICGNPDLNFIDGSSIWAQTISLAVAEVGNVVVDFIAKSKPERRELFAPLEENFAINIIDGTQSLFWNGNCQRRLTLPMMANLAVKLDQGNPYDVIIVRGFDIAKKLLDTPSVLAKTWLYLTDIAQSINDYDAKQRLICQQLAHGCQRLLCQTQGFKSLWMDLVPGLDIEKLAICSPTIPDFPKELPPLSSRPLRAIYAGKFRSNWMTLEMANAWPDIHSVIAGSELVMIGDKIHNEADSPNYQQSMLHALEHTAGLKWLGAHSREFVQKELQQARVGLSWRAESMNATVEYSTKIIEYGGAGCAAILNRNPLHEQLLGFDYPLFANSPQEFSKQLELALRDPTVANEAATALKRVAQCHTFSALVAEIRKWLQVPPKSTQQQSKTKVLVAGHDLKFFTLLQKKLEATGKFEFLIDQWQGHDVHDEVRSRNLLVLADVIFCEWCLGNLKWYSNNKLSHQRLVARFHLQERDLPYVAEANWDNIDHIIYVSKFIRREGQRAFGFPFEKTSVIPNLLDESKFTPKKKTSDARYTLGMVGVVPARKRFDRALDLLEALLEEDDRYCLRVKGRNPFDFRWLVKREEEVVFYRNVFERINSSPKLRYKVIFDPPGDNVNDWFTMVGFILSPSDFESFHMAIGEGMLTGSMPIIWDWDGAAEIWGKKRVFRTLQDAKRAVVTGEPNEGLASEIISAMSSQDTLQEWQKVFQKS